MQHARYFDIGDVAIGAKNFPRHIVARNGQTHHFVLCRRFGFGQTFHIQRIANPFVPFHFGVEEFATDQFCIAYFLATVSFDRNLTIVNCQLSHWHIEFFAGQIQQNATRFCGRIAQGFGTRLNAQGTGGAALVQRGGRIAHHNFDFAIRHIQLIGHDLGNGHIQALAQVDLAVVSHHIAIGLNGHP